MQNLSLLAYLEVAEKFVVGWGGVEWGGVEWSGVVVGPVLGFSFSQAEQ